jgi:hypothetical protein
MTPQQAAESLLDTFERAMRQELELLGGASMGTAHPERAAATCC